jgi:meiotic recombination protein SPO11
MSVRKKLPSYNPKSYDKVRNLYEKGLKELIDLEKKELQLPEGTVKIDDLTTQDSYKRLHEIIDTIVQQILVDGRPLMKIPSTSSNNIIWDEVNDLLLLGEKTATKSLLTLTSSTDVARLARVLEIVHELLLKDIHATKREVFYSDVNLFKEQLNSDSSIEDASALLRTTRNSTHVVASAKGMCVGRLRIKDKGDFIDLESLGSGGWSITPLQDCLEIVESDAEFVLVVEKDAAVIRLAEARWWRRFPCIILTGKGMADLATRMFLKKLSKLGLPIFLLVDSDPYGFYISSVYQRGSKAKSGESAFMATPLHLLGVHAKDLDIYNIPDSCKIPLGKADIDKAKLLINEPYVPQAIKDDLSLMLKKKMKAEIQALSSKGFEFLTDEYLPRKLEQGDWF